MRDPRRIFKGRKTGPRLGGSGLVLSCAFAAAAVLAVGLPSNLFGSAPADRPIDAQPEQVRIFDGETLGLGDRVLRLSGLAAPSRGTVCGAGMAQRDCGEAAAAELARLLAGQTISCRIEGYDSFRRGLARCSAGGRDINAAMVEAGYATASSSTLRAVEAVARDARQGLWADATNLPANWRQR